MVKEVNCNEAGFDDCAFLVRDEDEEELIAFVQQHAEHTHDTSVSRSDVQELVREI